MVVDKFSKKGYTEIMNELQHWQLSKLLSNRTYSFILLQQVGSNWHRVNVVGHTHNILPPMTNDDWSVLNDMLQERPNLQFVIPRTKQKMFIFIPEHLERVSFAQMVGQQIGVTVQ